MLHTCLYSRLKSHLVSFFLSSEYRMSLPSRNRWALSKPSLDTGLFCIEEEEEQGEEEEEAIFRTN
jgi:hypothetical protein